MKKATPVHPAIVLSGDAQADSLAWLLSRLSTVTAKFDIVYADHRHQDSLDKQDAGRCAFFLQQYGSNVPKVARSCTRITFPVLRFRLLWPFSAPNPYNRPDEENPTGPYPFGDAFIIAAVEDGTPADEILRRYEVSAWNAEWPNLDGLFKSETSLLLEMDGACDVKIGSFVLKHFRKRRLFWSEIAPANELLCELAYRLLHACFGRETPVDRDTIRAALSVAGARDLMAHVAVPIHMLVAQHFQLEWYEKSKPYPSLKGSRTFDEYYRGMVTYISTQRARESDQHGAVS